MALYKVVRKPQQGEAVHHVTTYKSPDSHWLVVLNPMKNILVNEPIIVNIGENKKMPKTTYQLRYCFPIGESGDDSARISETLHDDFTLI